MSTSKTVRGITPILQARLTAQMAKVCDALDDFDLDRAYRATKTLISISPPKVKAKVIDELNDLDEKLEEALHSNEVDLYTGQRKASYDIEDLYAERVRPLFDRVVHELYEGGYMENYARDVDTNVLLKELF